MKNKQMEIKIIWDRIVSKIFLSIGVFNLFTGIMFVMISIFYGEVLVAIFIGGGFIGVGLAFGIPGNKKIKLVRLFKRYVGVISGSQESDLSKIAQILGEPLEIVKKNLNNMILKGYFVNAYINNKNNHIIIGGRDLSEIDTSEASFTSKICNNCGAKSIGREGKVTECEYCGSKIVL